MTAALLLVDFQLDYFPGGRYPLWNTGSALEVALSAVARARDDGLPVVHVQHVAESADAALFAPGTPGIGIHPLILAAAPDAPVVVKRHADAFHGTELGGVLAGHGVDRLLLAGMMTQNCIAHTALSKAAEPFEVVVLADATTTVDPMVHGFALAALRTRFKVVDAWGRAPGLIQVSAPDGSGCDAGRRLDDG